MSTSQTAWFEAARMLNATSLRQLLQQGADVNWVDADGCTALYYAVTPYGGSYKVVKLLVEAGANLHLSGNSVEELIRAGWEGVSSAGEANEMSDIEAFLRQVSSPVS